MSWIQTSPHSYNTTPAVASIATTFSSNNTSGNCLLVIVTWNTSFGTLSGVTDTAGNTWTQVGGNIYDSSESQSAAIFAAFNCVGGVAPTITATFNGSGAQYVGIRAAEYSNAVGIDAFTGRQAANTTAANNLNTGNITTTANNEQIVGLFINTDNASNITAGTSPVTFTDHGAGADTLVIIDCVQSTAGSIAATATITGSVGRYIGFAVALSPSPTVGTNNSTSVTVDSVAPTTYIPAGTGTSISWNHTCSGGNRLLTVSVTVGISGAPITTTTATYNGISMTSAAKQSSFNQPNSSNWGYVELFYLVNPPTGTNTVVVTCSASQSLLGSSISFNGVDQTSPYTSIVTKGGNSATASATIPSYFGNMVIDALCTGTYVTKANSANQAMQWSHNGDTNSGAGDGAQSVTAGMLSVTSSYAVTSDYWGLITMDIRSSSMYSRPILVGAYRASYSTTGSTKTASVTTKPGDYLVVYAGGQDSTDVLTTPTGNGITFALQQSIVISSYGTTYLWTATDRTGGTWTMNMTNTFGSSEYWGFTCLVFRNTAGFGSSYQNHSSASGASTTINATTSTNESGLVLFATDWNAMDGTTRSWYMINNLTPNAVDGMELDYAYVSGQYTAYGAYYYDAGNAGPQTIGTVLPTGEAYAAVAIIVLPPAPLVLTPISWIRA